MLSSYARTPRLLQILRVAAVKAFIVSLPGLLSLCFELSKTRIYGMQLSAKYVCQSGQGTYDSEEEQRRWRGGGTTEAPMDLKLHPIAPATPRHAPFVIVLFVEPPAVRLGGWLPAY